MHNQFQRLLPLVFVLILVGCGGQAATPTPAPTTVPAPTTAAVVPTVAPATGGTPDTATVAAGIKAALALYVRAYNENSSELLDQAVDQDNAAFRRLVQERYDYFKSSLIGQSMPVDYTLKTVEARDLGFYLATIERWDGNVVDWFFRQLPDGRWVLSEPTEQQIGERKKVESEHFVFYVYPWGDDLTPKLMTLMENARARVLKRLGKVPDIKNNVYIRPIFGILPPEPATALAYYKASSKAIGDRMVIFAPHSFAFGSYDPALGWEKELEDTLTHEYTHLVNNRVFTPIARMSDWMFEGLAEYVADNPRAGEVRAAVQANAIIPIFDPNGGTTPQELDKLSILEKDQSLAYGLAYSLVAYISETYGGLDGFWKLVDTNQNAPGTGERKMDGALQAAFGVSYKQFDSDWRAWLAKNY